MSELLKRRWIAALAPKGSQEFSIIATNGDLDIHIRVKTKSAQYDGWHWGVKKGGVVIKSPRAEHDFTVLVSLATEDGKPNHYFIVPTTVIDRWIKEDFEHWLATPGMGGRPHNPENKLRMLNLRERGKDLNPYKDQWNLLWRGCETTKTEPEAVYRGLSLTRAFSCRATVP